VAERETLRAALAQMCSADTHDENIATVTGLAARAADQGAELLCLPEVAGLMNRNGDVARTQVVAAEDDPFIGACRDLATRHGVWIHIGSTPVLAPDGRFLNRSAVIDAAGEIRATYDKVHLFDVQIDGQPPIGESKRFAPGDALVLLDTPWGPWGLTICYDLRFPYVYRRYGQEGATLIFIPSAFTVPTGRAHWEVLIRARAIESGAFILAAAQAGDGHRAVVEIGRGGPDPVERRRDVARRGRGVDDVAIGRALHPRRTGRAPVGGGGGVFGVGADDGERDQRVGVGRLAP
jgi:predicted amidohydrolase